MTQSWIPHTIWYKDTDVVNLKPYNGGKYSGKITVVAGATDYNGTLGMADATVEALASTKKIKITPPNGAPALAVRFRFDGSANDSNVLEMYVGHGVDHYHHRATLTILQGTQLYSTGIYFGDKCTPSNEVSYSTVTELSAETNFVAEYVFNLHGADRVLFLCSTLAATTIYVDWRIIP